MTLCDFELDVLRMLDGQPQDSIKGWGAGLGVAIEGLYRAKYVDRRMKGGAIEYFITDKGRAPITPRHPTTEELV